MFIGIITIPFGIASLRIAGYALWPFGATVVQRPDAGVASTIGNVLWVLFCGWWLALAHLASGVVLCLTIIGIPRGLANFKLIPLAFWPLGREIVSIEEAEGARHGPGAAVSHLSDVRLRRPSESVRSQRPDRISSTPHKGTPTCLT